MSDEALLMMTGLWVAFCFAAAETALRRAGGVHDDGKADRCTDGLSRGPDGSGVHRHGLDRGANPMKEQDEHRGQVIDFLAARDRIALRRWAVAHGFVRLPMRPR